MRGASAQWRGKAITHDLLHGGPVKIVKHLTFFENCALGTAAPLAHEQLCNVQSEGNMDATQGNEQGERWQHAEVNRNVK